MVHIGVTAPCIDEINWVTGDQPWLLEWHIIHNIIPDCPADFYFDLGKLLSGLAVKKPEITETTCADEFPWPKTALK